MNAILFEAMEKLEAESADLILDFKYFIQRFAPVSGKRSLLDVDCSFSGSLKRGEKMQFTLGVKVPYTSLCPCSKEISQYGAHNQRGMMNVRLSYNEGFDCIFIEKNNEEYCISKEFKHLLNHKEFYNMIQECIAFGLYRYQKNYINRYKDTDFVLYQKYTYQQVYSYMDI